MKHSITLKFLAIVVAAISLVTAVGCGAGIVAMESAGLYINSLDELQEPIYKSIAEEIATAYTDLYAAENLGNLNSLPYTLAQSLYADPRDRSDAEHWRVKISQDGVGLEEAGTQAEPFSYSKEYTIAPLYFIASLSSPEELARETTPSEPEYTEPTISDPEPRSDDFDDVTVPGDYLYSSQETSFQGGRLITYYLYYYQAPEYTVTVQLHEEVLEYSSLHLLTTSYPYRYTFIVVLALALLLAAVCVVYLLTAAGHCANGSVRPGGLNRLPLDLYACMAGGSIVILAWLFLYLLGWIESEGPHPGNLSLMAVNLLAIAVIGIAFVFAFAAQVKAGNAFWWHHSIIGWCCGKIAAGFRLLGRGISAVMRLLPLMWQWPVTAGCMVLSLVITGLLCFVSIGGPLAEWFFLLLFLADILLCAVIVIYSGYCFGVLMKGAKRMSEGDLNCKIPTKYLRGNFLDFALQLNSLSEAALITAKKQMRSERMKSELITNVSHDFKTPLTSIINYVDLLQKPHSEQQQQEYLEVLSRQSGQMKKLIEDLMELSKASSGSINVNLQQIDASETVNQALGEFSDKLEAAGLTPVFRQPEQPLMITADGRLVWRVLFNLLTNAVKYAMPGTRLYVDLMQVEERVLLSLKNVSRAPLTVPAEDLLERFVRDDASRKSEGSGLGLNIAKNLMEVQHGQLQLLLDGDLFKVTLIFPAAEG